LGRARSIGKLRVSESLRSLEGSLIKVSRESSASESSAPSTLQNFNESF